MGLSGCASWRHPHVMVMAPALTETGQTQSFTSLPTPSLNLLGACDIAKYKINKEFIKAYDLAAEESFKGPNGTTSKRSTPLRPLDLIPSGGHSSMNSSTPMGDNSEQMGQLKNIASCVMPDGQENFPVSKSLEFEQMLEETPTPSVEELMKALNNIEETDGTCTPDFHLSAAELAFDNVFLLNNEEVVFADPANSEPTPDLRLTLIKDKETEVIKQQHLLERQQSRLLRRIKKLETREIGRSAAKELTNVVKHACRLARPVTNSDKLPSDSRTKSELTDFIEHCKLNSAHHNPSNNRHRPGVRYFGSGSSEFPHLGEIVPNLVPKLSQEERDAVKATCSQLSCELSLTEKQLDSDATDSSSGGDSCDESVNYTHPAHNYLSIRKRSFWRWHQDRGLASSRWMWVSAQLNDLDFRVRHLTDHYKKVREDKGVATAKRIERPASVDTSTAAPTINGYHGTLPGASPSKCDLGPNGTISSMGSPDPAAYSTCSRTCYSLSEGFRKRKLLRWENLHVRSESLKVARPATTPCWCKAPDQCLLCTGRPDATQPAGWFAVASTALQDRIGALDPAYHPILSVPQDVPLTLHLESIMRQNEWQSRTNRCSYKYNKYKYPKEKQPPIVRLKKEPQIVGVEHKTKIHKQATALLSAKLLKKKMSTGHAKKRDLKNYLLQNSIPPLKIRKTRKVSSKSEEDSDDESDLYVSTVGGDSGCGSPEVLTGSCSTAAVDRGDEYRRRGRSDSYDINNIVIPYSMAASTRVEMLQYKEIPTPKWRLVEERSDDALSRCDEVEEDVSEEAVIERHARCEDAERRKFMSYIKLPLAARGRANRRTDSRAESSGANTPDPMSPMNADHGESPLATPPPTPQGSDELTISNISRRRTISSSRGILRDKLERAANADQERCLTPDPEDDLPPFQPRVYPIPTDEFEKMKADMPSSAHRSNSIFSFGGNDSSTNDQVPSVSWGAAVKRCAGDADKVELAVSDGEAPVYHHSDPVPESPGSSSTMSAVEEVDDDPNDPEWQAADEEEFEDYQCKGRR